MSWAVVVDFGNCCNNKTNDQPISSFPFPLSFPAYHYLLLSTLLLLQQPNRIVRPPSLGPPRLSAPIALHHMRAAASRRPLRPTLAAASSIVILMTALPLLGRRLGASAFVAPIRTTARTFAAAAGGAGAMEKRVLVPVADGSEEIESVTIIDVLVRAGEAVRRQGQAWPMGGWRRAGVPHYLTRARRDSIQAPR